MHKVKKIVLYTIILASITSFFMLSSVNAQYWQAIPPYNLLWPLWVDALSPLGVPAVSTIDVDTVLPIQPCWVWNNDLNYPWFLYDFSPGIAGGLLYYDLFSGFLPFGTGEVPTLSLPLNYQYLLPPWGATDFGTWANQSVLFFEITMTNAGYPSVLSQLALPVALWGIPLF